MASATDDFLHKTKTQEIIVRLMLGEWTNKARIESITRFMLFIHSLL
jgi:hypothetical protein